MTRIALARIAGALLIVGIAGCGESAEQVVTGPEAIVFRPGPDNQMTVQEALIEAEEGAVIQFEEGVFEFSLGLSLDVDGVTIRGRGMDKTILDFKNQEAGSEGLFVSSNRVTLEDFAIVDTKGNGMKSHGSEDIVIRRVRTEWTGGPKATNGAYGLYPVLGKRVLVEESVAIGASDAGIYVGQSEDVIIRNNRAEYNVAGIEIENCHRAEAYGNVATNNTGGLLVFDLPDLPVQRGRDVRLFENEIYANNTPNFAPEGNIVAGVATGTGIMVMANSNVEIFDNSIRDNGTFGILVASYFGTGIEIKDPNYYPYAEGVHIHHNSFGESGSAPAGDSGMLVAAATGTPIPDIVWDGVANPERVVDGRLVGEARIVVHDNRKDGGEVSFADIGGLAGLADPSQAEVNRDIAAFAGELPPVKAVVLSGTG